ncbi:hypothetical protein [Streptomyces sp. NPDC001744]|uniref:hypothetical protein n=1 Tax=Streptomyces sp. NPDC001744 TaxID=3364606 RepID=UPI0036C04BD7
MANKEAQHLLGLRRSRESELEFHEGTREELTDLVAEVDGETAARMRTADERVSAVRSLSDPNEIVEYYKVQAAKASADEILMRELSNKSPEEQQAIVDRWHGLTDFGTCIIYHGYSFAGRGVPFSITWPNFNWWPYDCNDAGSSVKAWGVNVLWEHSYYRGRSVTLAGFPYAEFPDLRDFGFDNLTSSVVCVG